MDEKTKLIILECIREVLMESNSFSQYDPNKSVRTGDFRKILGIAGKSKSKGDKVAGSEPEAPNSPQTTNAQTKATPDSMDLKVIEIAQAMASKYRLPLTDVRDIIFGAYGKEGKELEDYATKSAAKLKLHRGDFLALLDKISKGKKDLQAKKEKRRAMHAAEKEKQKSSVHEPEKGEDRGEKSNSSIIPQRIRDTMEKKFQHWKETGYINLFPLAAGAPYKIFKYDLPEHYRAICFDDDGQLVWTWVGSHEDYNDIWPKEIARIKRYLSAKEQVKHRGKLNPPTNNANPKPNIFEASTHKFEPLFKPDGSLNV